MVKWWGLIPTTSTVRHWVAVNRQESPYDYDQTDHEEHDTHNLETSEKHGDTIVHPGGNVGRKAGDTVRHNHHLSGEDVGKDVLPNGVVSRTISWHPRST